MRTIYLFLGKNGEVEGWSSTDPLNGAVAVTVEDDHEVLTKFNKYNYIDGKLVESDQRILKAAKNNKINQFNEICERLILEGFLSSNGHYYRTNRDDQMNMTGKKEELNDFPDISEVLWKTEDEGYISHTREEWIDQVYYEALRYRETQLLKYDHLKNEVLESGTLDEVNQITWS